jgi:hypothetical protein
MVSPQGNNAPGINGYNVTIGTDANGEGQIIKNVAISASEKIFRVMDIKNLAWNSTDSYDPTIS